MRQRLKILGVLLLCAFALLGCGRKGVPVMALGGTFGQAMSLRDGYYVQLQPVAGLVGAEISLNNQNDVVIQYVDGTEKLLSLASRPLLLQRGTVYALLDSLPSLLGIRGIISEGNISLELMQPEIELAVSEEGITIKASSAISMTGQWISHDTYEFIVPHATATDLNPDVVSLDNSIFTELRLFERPEGVIASLTGDSALGYEPWVHFPADRTIAHIAWPRQLGMNAGTSTEGRNIIELVLPPGKTATVLPAPTLTQEPKVRLRQRADLLAGPEALFPVVKGPVAQGTEGAMLGYTPGWVRVRLQGYEGWLPERTVSVELTTPEFPLSLRSQATVAANVVAVVPPGTHIVLKEKIQGGYTTLVPSLGVEGYLLDGQLFLDSIMHLPPHGLSRVIRFEVPGSLPPATNLSNGFFTLIDAVPHKGSTVVTLGVPALMNIELSQSQTHVTVAAGVSLEGVVINSVTSGQQLEFITDGAHELTVKRTSSGLSISIPYAVLHRDFTAPAGKGSISNIEVTQLPSAVEVLLSLDMPLSYRIFESRLVTVMSNTLAGKTIVIDPGHGGRDPGALGKLNWDEKHYTLDIAKRLARELKALGAIPVLTHEGVDADKKVLTDERLMTINRPEVDLFLSIHLNAFTMASLRGAETYYFNRDENRRLAQILQQSMVAVGMRNRGVINSRTLALLRRGQPPGVLLEVGYITSPDDERFLSIESNRDVLALELVRGLDAFFAAK